MQAGSASRVVVVGAGLGGLRTAEELRQLGHDGDISVIGAETHPPYSRPPLSKEVLRGEAAPETAHLRDAAAIDELGIDLILGRRAEQLDAANHDVVLEDGSAVHYDRLVVATGATPRQLPGIASSNVHVLRTLDDAIALRDVLSGKPRVAVVGA